MDQILKLRASDQARAMVDDMTTQWPKAAPILGEEPYPYDPTEPSRKTYFLDTDATLKKSPKGTFSEKALKLWVNSYGHSPHTMVGGKQKPSTQAAIDHYFVLRAWREGKAQLLKFCPR